MAPRLTVIISQSAKRDGRSIDTEESMVAYLMMTPGLDATLVGALETMQADSTDFLCLSSFQHNFALLSWLDEASVNIHWKRLGLAGSVAKRGALDGHGHKPRIYYLPLNHATSVTDVLHELEQLQNERSVQTVNIMLSSTPPKPVTANEGGAMQIEPAEAVAGQEASSLPTQSPSNSPTQSNQQKVSADLPGATPSLAPLDTTRAHNGQRDPVLWEVDDDEDWEELDRLVDDLDAFKF